MRYRNVVHTGVLSVLLVAASRVCAAPPNIILFLVDDLGWQDTQVVMTDVPTENNLRLRTPALLRLASEGMTLTDAYAASPVCSPTRASIMTGRNPARTRITDWLGHYGPNGQPAPSAITPDNHLGVPDWNRVGLTSNDDTLAHALRRHGYRTIHIGKAHFGTRGNEGADPRVLGFDVNIAGWHRGAPGSYRGTENFGTPESGWQVPDLEAYHGTNTYLTDALTVEAERELRAAVDRDSPFFLHFAHYGVHTPIHPDDHRVQHYLDRGMTVPQANYASMIESVDASLMRIIDVLDELDIADNTIVVFFSDNGCLTAHSGPLTTAAPLKGGKGTAYEGGYRVPMVIRYPGVIAPATRCSQLIMSDDVLPTLLSLASINDPPARLQAEDGFDLAPLLRGEVASGARTVVPIHYPHYWWKYGGIYETPGIEPFTAFRSGDWKLIYFHGDDRSELYNLAVDLSEENNLAHSPQHAHILDQLQTQLGQWMREVDAQVMRDRATDLPRVPDFARLP